MKKYVTILKGKGIFYNVYGEDAFVMSSITNNKIQKDRLCFTERKIKNIKHLLDKNKINYKIKKESNIIEEKTYKRSNYNKYLKKGFDKYNKNIEKEILIDKIKKLDDDKVTSISKYVNYVIYK